MIVASDIPAVAELTYAHRFAGNAQPPRPFLLIILYTCVAYGLLSPCRGTDGHSCRPSRAELTYVYRIAGGDARLTFNSFFHLYILMIQPLIPAAGGHSRQDGADI